MAMDSKAWISVGVTLALFAFVAFMFVFGQAWLGFDEEDPAERLQRLMAPFVDSPNAILIVIAFYCVLAMTGFPQFLLFSVTVALFGPVIGMIYSWIATMCSSTLTFLMGRLFGGRFVAKLSGERVQAFMRFVERRGVLASALVRITPSAPFIIVNAAAGSVSIPLWKFWLGTGIGVAPKIVVVAFFWKAVQAAGDFFRSRDPADLALMAIIIPAWIAFLLLMRWLYLHFRNRYRSQME
ncbi:MAG: VTT domain-containing protein [Pseudomonadota bacterium]